MVMTSGKYFDLLLLMLANSTVATGDKNVTMATTKASWNQGLKSLATGIGTIHDTVSHGTTQTSSRETT